MILILLSMKAFSASSSLGCRRDMPSNSARLSSTGTDPPVEEFFIGLWFSGSFGGTGGVFGDIRIFNFRQC